MLIPLDLVMRAVIVPLIPTLFAELFNDEDPPTVVVTRLPGKF
jgi:hypothetical protein